MRQIRVEDFSLSRSPQAREAVRIGAGRTSEPVPHAVQQLSTSAVSVGGPPVTTSIASSSVQAIVDRRIQIETDVQIAYHAETGPFDVPPPSGAPTPDVRVPVETGSLHMCDFSRPSSDEMSSWIAPYMEDFLKQLTGYVPAGLSGGDAIIHDRHYEGDAVLAQELIQIELARLGIPQLIQAFTAHSFIPNSGPTVPVTSFPGVNIFAELAPDRPDVELNQELVIIGAHYDTTAVGHHGANDNGTGVAAVMAIARHLAAQTCRRRRVIFVFFDLEEQTRIEPYEADRGSGQFNRYLLDRIASTGERVHSVHTIDQLGWDLDGDRAIQLELPRVDLTRPLIGAASAALPQLYEEARRRGSFSLPLVTIETPEAYSDFSSFSADFAAIGVTEEFNPDPVTGARDTSPLYHTPYDTYFWVNKPYLTESTEFLGYVFELLARGDL